MFFLFIENNELVMNMYVKIFDFEHEKDLEESINLFLEDEEIEIKEILYQTSHFFAINEQVFSFSAMILYQKKPKNI